MRKEKLLNIVTEVCNENFGFAPSKSKIHLMESDEVGHYIMFSVGGVIYQINYLDYMHVYTIDRYFD